MTSSEREQAIASKQLCKGSYSMTLSYRTVVPCFGCPMSFALIDVVPAEDGKVRGRMPDHPFVGDAR